MSIQEEFRCCTSARHTANRGFPYPKHRVPVRCFKRPPGDRKKEDLKSCEFCREVDREYNRQTVDKLNKQAEEQKQLVVAGQSKFMFCPDRSHDGASNSKHPRNMVPIDSFRKYPGTADMEMFVNCADCRAYSRSTEIPRLAAMLEEAKVNNRTLCHCGKDITDVNEISMNGTIAKMCSGCRATSRRNAAEAKIRKKEVKLERIEKYQMSCPKCQCLFFAP